MRRSRESKYISNLAQKEVTVPAGSDAMEMRIRFNKGETIHTENRYRFNTGMIDEMLTAAGFSVRKAWTDPLQTIAVTLAAER
jgi:uncharacterized SAM-dependent methyltransferase